MSALPTINPEWEEPDELMLARAEVLSLLGLLAELDRMEEENKDDSLGGYCGHKVADFKRRYREAIARNGGAPDGDCTEPNRAACPRRVHGLLQQGSNPMTAELSSINPNTSLRGVVVSLPVKIPANLKCPPDPLAMLETLRESERRWAANDYMNYDRPDATALIDEVERLQVAEFGLGEILEATTGVPLVLSRLQNVIAAMGPEEARAVARFAEAVREATK